jgi:uncharacterized protein YjbI with pentapeptide repeats
VIAPEPPDLPAAVEAVSLDLAGPTEAGARLEQARVRAVRFDRCDLSAADLSGARLSACELRGCTLGGLRGAERLRGAAMPWHDILAAAGVLAEAVGVTVLDD